MKTKKENPPCLCGAYDHKNGACFNGAPDKPQRTPTPTPWKIANNKGMDFPMIVTPEKEQPKHAIAEVYPTSGQFDENNDFFALGNALANAAMIVKAVNNYDGLIKFVAQIALQSSLGTLRDEARELLKKAEGE